MKSTLDCRKNIQRSRVEQAKVMMDDGLSVRCEELGGLCLTIRPLFLFIQASCVLVFRGVGSGFNVFSNMGKR